MEIIEYVDLRPHRGFGKTQAEGRRDLKSNHYFVGLRPHLAPCSGNPGMAWPKAEARKKNM
jgi:hypothetical protein